MARGNEIVLTSPYGRKMEGIIDGTPKPGTIMQIKAATAAVGGRLTWEVYNRDATGNRPQGPIAVLDIDHLQGRTADDAYVLDADAGWGEPLVARLERFKLRTPVTFEPVDWQGWAVRGAQATEPAGELVVAVDRPGEGGWDVLGPAVEAPAQEARDVVQQEAEAAFGIVSAHGNII